MAQKKSSDVVSIEEAKRWLRRLLIRRRQSIPLARRKVWSRGAVNRLVRTPLYKKSKSIALFLGFSSEIITDSLIKHAWKEKKNVLLPITSQGFHKPFFALFHKGDRLKRTSFGPMELVKKKKPFNFRSIDLVVIPGLGFDERGYRLGYGGGVYDRILKKTPRAKHVGLFFSCQFLPKLPTGRHDKSMDAIVTERSFLPF
jgi:5-formyltetrahydrofolate cyclo-ligase